MIKKFFGIMILFIVLLSVAFSELPEDLKKEKNQINKTTLNEQWGKIALNNLEMWFSNNGMNSQNPITSSWGLMFPKWSDKNVVYQDGPILGGMVGDSVRLHGATFLTSLQPGPFSQGVDLADPQSRIYMIRKDWKTLPETMKFTSGPDYTKAHYNHDYNEWPIDMGAPYELGGNGNKVPKFIGDEQAWFIMNDIGANTSNFYGTVSCGTKWHSLIWAYNLAGPLANVIFKKYTIINKGSNTFENAYLNYWSDPDIGDATDDLVISSISIAGTGFTLSGGTTPITIAAFVSRTIAVLFSPTELIGYTGTVTLTHNANGSPSTINLIGVGVTRNIAIDPNPLVFGDVGVGNLSEKCKDNK
jgi:hypothetical protein